ncbi:MAG: sigma-54 dependent transcriptional regulator [Bacteroidota bacterium]
MDREAIQERFGIIGTSPAIRHVLDRIRMVAPTDITVLVSGESGVGKELVAEAIHGLSQRRHKPLVRVNSGSIPEGLIESELFGSEKGAYTGSVAQRAGYFEEANASSIFLDEIGEMPLQAQVRLLRVLENGQFSRVGSSDTQTTDARVIAATNKDLAREVKAGRFREDLYYRLSTVEIRIPPLRERREDILPIFDAMLYRYVQRYDAPRKTLTPEAERALAEYDWPGNVRELRNVAEQAVVLTRGREPLTAEQIQPFFRGVTAADTAPPASLVLARAAQEPSGADEYRERELLYRLLMELRFEVKDIKQTLDDLTSAPYAEPDGFDRFETLPVPVRSSPRADAGAVFIEDAPYELAQSATSEPNALPTLAEAEQDLIQRALERFDGNRRQTAEALGISERTLYRKIKEAEE